MAWKNLSEDVAETFSVLEGCWEKHDRDEAFWTVISAFSEMGTRPEVFVSRVRLAAERQTVWTAADLLKALELEGTRQERIWLGLSMQELGWLATREGPRGQARAVYRREPRTREVAAARVRVRADWTRKYSEMRRLRAEGVRVTEISRRLGCDKGLVSRVCRST